MRTGLDASTVTPGRTPPDASVTTPDTLAALVACAEARGDDTTNRAIAEAIDSRRMIPAFLISKNAGVTSAQECARGADGEEKTTARAGCMELPLGRVADGAKLWGRVYNQRGGRARNSSSDSDSGAKSPPAM
jgi:hypothetical protein